LSHVAQAERGPGRRVDGLWVGVAGCVIGLVHIGPAQASLCFE
jgi:hypothetical protein